MKAFLIGLLFVLAVLTLAGVGLILSPLILAFSFLLRILVYFGLVFFAIWLLGKFIMFIWSKINETDE